MGVTIQQNYGLQWNPPLGLVKVSLLEGEFVLKSMLWDFSKWPEYRGGHISGVLIRVVSLSSTQE